MVQLYSLGGVKCALPCGHIGATCRIWLNLYFFQPTWVHNPNGKIDRFSCFCTASRQKVPILYNVQPFPPKLPLPMGDLNPHLTHDSLGISEPTTQRASRPVLPFLQMTAECPYTLQWDAPSPSKSLLLMGDLDPHLIHGSVGQPESSTQTASRSVQPFSQGSLVWQSDR